MVKWKSVVGRLDHKICEKVQQNINQIRENIDLN